MTCRLTLPLKPLMKTKPHSARSVSADAESRRFRINTKRGTECAALLSLFLLAACESLPTWMGGDPVKEEKLKGTRIDVLDYQSELIADAQLADEKVTLLPPEVNGQWASETDVQHQGLENLAVSGFSEAQSASVGEGNGWETLLITAPVIADGMVFAMDALGYITAHNANDIDRVLWQSAQPVLEEEEPIGGGGLSYANGVLYVTTGTGSMMALVAKDGSLLWRQDVSVPIRSAPAVAEGQVYATTIDNQLLAHDARTGKPVWSHRGIRENALFLGTVSPAVENGIVIAAYTSGELYALRAEDGSPLWSDTLITSRRTTADSSLTGIDATPLIRRGVVYAISNSGLMVANLLSNGKGIWDKQVAGSQTPWIGGDYVFTLTSDSRLMAVHRKHGGVKWVRPFRIMENGRNVTPHLTGPIMVNDRLVLISAAGEMLMISPQDGKVLQRMDIPDDVKVPVVVANKSLYMLTNDAALYRYQ